MRARLNPLRDTHSRHSDLKLYVRFDPTVNGNGGGGPGNGGADSALTDTSTGHPIPVAYDTNTVTNAANRDYAQPVFAALDGPFAHVTSGFAGAASDGLTQLDASQRLTTINGSADIGNIVQVAEVKLGQAGQRHHLRPWLRCHTVGRSCHRRGLAARRLQPHPQGLREGLGALRQEPQPTAANAAGPQPRPRPRACQRLLREHQRGEGRGRQDLPRRDRCRAVVSVGSGRVGRRSRITRTSVRIAKCSPAICTRRGPA